MLRILLLLTAIVLFVSQPFDRGLSAADPESPKHSEKETSGINSQPISAEDALEMLKQGNARFAKGHLKHPHESRHRRLKLVSGQRPIATVLGCSDSRVIPELIFDEGIGDLFVIRVAGNVVDEDIIGSIEYAVDHLDTHLVVVLGHENCGAVTAALDTLNDDEPRELTSLVNRIHDSICRHHDGEPDVGKGTNLSTAVRKNVMCSVRGLSDCSDLCSCMKAHNVMVVGAVYDMKTGKVDWLDSK